MHVSVALLEVFRRVGGGGEHFRAPKTNEHIHYYTKIVIISLKQYSGFF